MLNRGVSTCKQSLPNSATSNHRRRAFASLLCFIRSIPNVRHVHFTADRPHCFARQLVHTYTRLPGIYRRFRVPFRSNSGRILGTVTQNCARRGCHHVVSAIHHCVPSTTVDTSTVINFPNRARRRFRRALSLIGSVTFSRLGATTCSPHPNAPTTL